MELAEILKKFFFEIDLDKKMYSIKQELSKNVNLDTNPNEINLPNSQSHISKNFYKTIKLEGIKIISKQPTKKANHYRVSYRDKWQNSGFFFLDSYFRDKKDLIQPDLITNLLLVRGYKYQFYLKNY